MKVVWSGTILSVQPRLRLTRSSDQRSHTYLGYALRIDDRVDGEPRNFTVGIGTAAQTKQQFRVGDVVSGEGEPVADPRLEVVNFYKAPGLKVEARAPDTAPKAPPWHGAPPDLEVYRQRGHRRPAARTYELKCSSCVWGAEMAVEMIIDHWNPSQRRYRVETFCYGPKSCRFYAAGPTRKVPGRKGMSWEEEDWIDAEATAHRDDDE